VTRESRVGRGGRPTLLVNGVTLHSSYDPEREARRVCDGLLDRSAAPATIIVVGEGVPYLADELRRRVPTCRILSLSLGPVPDDARDSLDLDGVVTETVRDWIRRRLHPLDAPRTDVVVWEAARRAAPGTVSGAEHAFLAAMRDLQGQIATVGSFGRRWLANAVRNAVCVDETWIPTALPERLIVATSGPGLSMTLSAPASRDGDRAVLATSSALATLRARGRAPDLIMHTDGGFWAARYLNPPALSAGVGTSAPLLAFPSRAALPMALYRHRVATARAVPLRTGWLGDALAPDSDRWMAVAEQPTVAASTLAFATSLAPTADLVLAGFDLASYGFDTHSRPHANDTVIAGLAHRLNPQVTQRVRRALGGDAVALTWSDGTPGFQTPALNAFQPAIRAAVASHRGPVARPAGIPATPALDGLAGVHSLGGADDRRAQRRESAGITARRHSRPPRRDRRVHVRRVLDAWRELTATVSDGMLQDATVRDLAFHLAPVATLTYQRGAGDADGVVAGIQAGLERLGRLVEHLDG